MAPGIAFDNRSAILDTPDFVEQPSEVIGNMNQGRIQNLDLR
jgi:hypothetical protein